MPPSKSRSKFGAFIEDVPEIIPPSTPSAPARSPSDRLREKIIRDSYSSSPGKKQQLSNSTKTATSLSSTNRSGATVEVIENDEPSEAMPADLIAIDIRDGDKKDTKSSRMSSKGRTASTKMPVSANIDKKVDASFMVIGEGGSNQEQQGSHHRRLVGVRRVVSEGLWRTSKSKCDKNRDGRVGAFALSLQSHVSLTDEDRPVESSDIINDEEEGRWISVVSSEQHSPPPPQGVVGCQTIPEGGNDRRASHTIPNAPNSSTGSSNLNPRGSDDKVEEEDDVFVCGMKSNVFIGVVITFSVLVIIMVAIAVSASKCRQALVKLYVCVWSLSLPTYTETEWVGTTLLAT